MASCWSCGRELPPAARYCSSCGARVQDALEVHEERKVVSVLFVDLVGSTAQADRRDPEDVRATLVPFYDGLRADIERYDGRTTHLVEGTRLAKYLSANRIKLQAPAEAMAAYVKSEGGEGLKFKEELAKLLKQ